MQSYRWIRWYDENGPSFYFIGWKKLPLMVKFNMLIFLYIHHLHRVFNFDSFTIPGVGHLEMKTTVLTILNFVHTRKCKMLSQPLIQNLHVWTYLPGSVMFDNLLCLNNKFYEIKFELLDILLHYDLG